VDSEKDKLIKEYKERRKRGGSVRLYNNHGRSS